MSFRVFESGWVLGGCLFLAAVLGAVMGSFLNCTAWRIARGESFVRGRSRCPACGHTLGALDLIPVFSWLVFRGHCRYCGGRIPVRYVLTELFSTGLAVLFLLRFDLTAAGIRNWLFFCCLFCLTLVDWDSLIIPDGCLLAAVVIWIAAQPFLGGGPWDALRQILAGLAFGGGLLAFSLALDQILKKDSLGGGDIKLMAVVGLYLGFVGALFTLILSCLLGLLLAGVLRRGFGRPFPFGPAISTAATLMLLFGDGLIHWYTGLISTIWIYGYR